MSFKNERFFKAGEWHFCFVDTEMFQTTLKVGFSTDIVWLFPPFGISSPDGSFKLFFETLHHSFLHIIFIHLIHISIISNLCISASNDQKWELIFWTLGWLASVLCLHLCVPMNVVKRVCSLPVSVCSSRPLGSWASHWLISTYLKEISILTVPLRQKKNKTNYN